MLRQYSPAVVCLQHVNAAPPTINNYRTAATYNHTEQEFGTAILVRNNIACKSIATVINSFQVTAIEAHLDEGEPYYIFNVYNQPSMKYDIKDLKKISEKHKQNLIILGDLNVHNPLWDEKCRSADKGGKDLERIADETNLCILNDPAHPTFYSKGHGKFTAIDLTICTENMLHKVEWFAGEDEFTSDHFPIITSILSRQMPTQDLRFNSKKARWEEFQLLTSDIPEFDPEIDHNELCKIITEKIIHAATKSIPRTNPKQRKKTVPWWHEGLQFLAKTKHKLKHKLNKLNQIYKNYQNQAIEYFSITKLVDTAIEIHQIKPLYNKVCAFFKREVNIAKQNSWREYVNTINEKTPLKSIWNKFRKIKGSNATSPKFSINNQGTMVHDDKGIADVLGTYLQKVCSNEEYDPSFLRYKTKAEKKGINFTNNNNNIYNVEITKSEFDHALKNSNISAPGNDLVDFEMIKNASTQAKTYLLKLYNHLLKHSLFPDAWRHSIVVPILKSGKDPTSPGSYRPISLTSCLCKLMEKIMNFRLLWYLKDKKAITKYQFAFQKGRSTLDSITLLEEHIKRNFVQRKITGAILFDIEKAYDRTWKHQVLGKMKSVGMEGELPKWIQNFLNNRSFQIKYNNTLSEEYQLINSLPQGSVLSCTLFLLAMNDVIAKLPKGICCTLYADDIIIYCSSRHLRHIDRALQGATDKIIKWSESIGMKISIDKTKAILFYKNKRWLANRNLTVKIKNKTLKAEDHVKYLGMILDSHMNWKRHTAYIKGRCKNALNLLKKLSNTNWGAHRNCLTTIYKATVEGILNYCCPIYATASGPTLRALDTIQTQGLRLCSGAFKSSPNISVIAESGELPLSMRRDLLTLSAGLRMMEGDSPAKELLLRPEAIPPPHTQPFANRFNTLIEQSNLTITVPKNTATSLPEWTLNNIEICRKMYRCKEKSPEEQKAAAIQHMHEKGLKYNIYTDGSKGEGGTAFAVYSKDKNISLSLPAEASIFTAEITAILYASKLIRKRKESQYVIYTDSQSAVEAINAFYSKNYIINKIKSNFHHLRCTGKHITLCWIPSHVGIRGNEAADALAKQAVEKPRCRITIPPTDYKQPLKASYKQKWQTIWDNTTNNKLREIKDKIGKPSSHSDRKTQVIFSRLQIGHTRLTHGHLMSTPKEPAPICDRCNVPITIKHIFNECHKYTRERNLYLGKYKSIEALKSSENFPKSNILTFLKETKLLDEI